MSRPLRRLDLLASVAVGALACFGLGATPARAVDGTWLAAPATNDFNTGTNWTSSPSVPNGTASFGASTKTSLIFSSLATNVGTLQFNAGAPAYSFALQLQPPGFCAPCFPQSLTLNSNGVVNQSGNQPTFTLFLGGGLTFQNSATASNANVVMREGNLDFRNNSSAGSAIVTMPDSLHAGFITFHDQSSAANATITTRETNGAQGVSELVFLDQSTAGNATINNNPGTVLNPTVKNGGNTDFGLFGGTDTADAGNAHITNNKDGQTNFYAHTSAMNAVIVNNTATGALEFRDQSTAANATITNNGGSIFLAEQATLANATVTMNGGLLELGFSGLFPLFIDTATLGNANIANNGGTITFNSGTTAGNATINNSAGGSIFFFDGSTGGSARFIMSAGSVFDMSGLTTGSMTAGSLEGAGNVFLGGNALTVGLNNLSTTFSGVISDGGSSGGTGGQLIKTGSGNFTLTNTETYTGATTVNGGILTVNGSIAASSGVTVNSGGTLAGTGTVAATTVNAGGTLAPGNGSVGTLTVNGNLTFKAGSTFLVDVTPTSAGKVVVNGTANLAGTVEAVFLPGSYLANSYTILTATGGRTGTFSNLVTVDLPAFLTASLTYDPNDVMLVTLHSNLVNRPGLTQNQTAVAATLDNSFNTGHGTLNGLSFVPANQIPAALDALSGEGTSGTQETAFGAGDLFLSAMMEQGQFWRSGTGAAGTTYAPLGYASETAQAPVFKAMPVKAPLVTEPVYRAWFAGFDGTWHLDGQPEPGSAALRHSTAGGAAGLDYQVNPNLLVGVAGGGSSSTFSEPDRATSGTLDGAHIGTYGVGRWGPWYAAGALAFNRFENKYTRAIAGVGPTETATGKFDSNMLSGRFEFGYRQIFSGFAVTPFVAVQFAELWQPGYSETSTMIGGAPGVLGLTYTAQTVSSLPTFLGAQFDTRVTLQNGIVWLPYARLSWVHEFESTRDVNAGFITLPVTNFTVFGPSAARDAARVDLGSKLAISRSVALFASFDGEFSDRSRMYAGKGGVRVTW